MNNNINNDIDENNSNDINDNNNYLVICREIKLY